MHQIISFLISIGFCYSCYSAEVDHFLYLKEMSKPKGSVKLVDLNQETNKVINGYLEQLAKKAKSCTDREDILNKTRIIFDTNFPDVTNDLLEASFDKNNVALEHQAIALSNITPPLYQGFVPPHYSGCCAPVVKLGNSTVGMDKIDHFLSHGFMYYTVYTTKRESQTNVYGDSETKIVPRTDSDEKRMNDVYELGDLQEESTWGLAGSGVKSYGDLAANYSGLQFYKNLLDGDDPYLKCVDDKLVVNRKFKIEEYVDDSWDESINCSSFNSQSNRDIVLKNMKDLGFEKCPVDAAKCAALVEKYKGAAAHILHPLCQNPKSEHTQVEKPRNIFFSTLKAMQFLEFNDLKKAAKGAK